MGYDPQFDANHLINKWIPAIGQLPEPMEDVVAAFRAVREVPAPDADYDITTVAAANAAEKVTELTYKIAMADKHVEARNKIAVDLARRCLAVAAESVPDLLDRVTNDFNSDVKEFEESLRGLPPAPTMRSIVEAGPSAVECYHRATAAQQRLDRWEAFIGSMRELWGIDTSKVLRLLRPASREQMQALLRAADQKTGDTGIRPLWVEAVEQEVSWGLNPPHTAREIEAEINSLTAQPAPGQRFASRRFR
jgi:hypothetical protein